jgi:FkbM family methyltransferase
MTELVNPAQAQRVLVHNKHFMQIDALDSLGLRANSQSFEPEETALCKKLIGSGDRVLDIGANIGYYTLLFCDLVAPGGGVTAIEPDSQNFEILRDNLQMQVADGTATLHQLAVGNTEQTATLFRAAENTGMHRMYPSVCCVAGSAEVRVIRGDSLALAPLNFIKIDIEGYEPFALQGFAQTLKQSPQVKILSEFSPLSIIEARFSPVAFLKSMRDQGFHLVAQQRQTWTQISYEDITRPLEAIPDLAIAEFERTLKASDGTQAITDHCIAFLTRHAYPRPIVENLLFVAPGAWLSVCNALGIEMGAALR